MGVSVVFQQPPNACSMDLGKMKTRVSGVLLWVSHMDFLSVGLDVASSNVPVIVAYLEPLHLDRT